MQIFICEYNGNKMDTINTLQLIHVMNTIVMNTYNTIQLIHIMNTIQLWK